MSKQEIYTITSALLMFYVSVAYLGMTGSYLQAGSMGATCFAFWWFGKQCVSDIKEQL